MKKAILAILCFASVTQYEFFPFASAHTRTSVLYFDPSAIEIEIGKPFSTDILIDTKGEYINAVSAVFSYPQDKLEVTQIDIQNSVLPFIIEQTIADGFITITGGIPTPGFSGTGTIATIHFATKSSGIAPLEFAKDSAILTNDTNKNIFDLANSKNALVQVSGDSLPDASIQTDAKPIIDLSFFEYVLSFTRTLSSQ